MQYDFDVAIIGGGSGGYAAARTAACAGLKTVVIEGAEEIGGLCILHGCMPTKALLYAAERLQIARDSKVWGVDSQNVTFDFAKAMARKNTLIQSFADDRRNGLLSGKFKFLRARARFLDPHTVELNTGEHIKAAHFVIATGSIVAPPPLPQLADIGYLTSDDALKLTACPKTLIVLGGGAIGCEFSQFMHRFGAKVTLVQRSPHVLHEFDADAAKTIETVFRREGVKLYTGTKLLDAKRDGKMKTVLFEHDGQTVSVSAEEVLFALGRRANTASLGLENAGVKLNGGRIKTNEFMQTSAPHIYAAGDCTGPHDIVHIAVLQGETAGQNIAKNGSRKMDDRLFLEVVFTDPHVAQAGLTEKQAQAKKIPYIAASYPFNDHGKSLIMEANDGFVKLLANPESGEIIGGACVGPAGGELIHEIVLAMATRMTVQEFALIPHYHPTLAEIWTYPAEELAAKIPNH
ncbi:MAG TPA: NAD(P)/FAD-dependent oxidoreductase [Verrucomicrobiae bacterium]|nr:NAD(P)/FAD-dependent oxidoreductase [Verrucomicrobiae bacterium]